MPLRGTARLSDTICKYTKAEKKLLARRKQRIHRMGYFNLLWKITIMFARAYLQMYVETEVYLLRFFLYKNNIWLTIAESKQAQTISVVLREMLVLTRPVKKLIIKNTIKISDTNIKNLCILEKKFMVSYASYIKLFYKNSIQ